MYVRISRVKKKSGIYEYYQLVESKRVGTTVTKRVVCSLGTPDNPSLPTSLLELLLKGKEPKFYAFPVALYHIVKHDLDLHTILSACFKDSRITSDVFLLTTLMIIHRILDPDSKLALTRWYANILLPVPLPKAIDVSLFYYTLDYLLEKKENIEQQLLTHLRGKGLTDATVIFYDLTSSYFEGEDVGMAAYGYSRDHRPDCLQITLGLVIDKHGLPIYHEVFSGNTPDGKTVKGILQKLKTTFHLSNIVFVADKGMLTPDNLKELEEKKYQSILSESVRNALSQKTREELFLQKDAFTRCRGMEDTLWYTTTLSKEGNTVILCYNPQTACKAKQTRDGKIKKLQTFINGVKEKHKTAGRGKTLQMVRDMIMAKLVTSHARKYFDTKQKPTIADLFPLRQEVLTREEHMDGMWVVISNTERMTTEELITTYKELKTIEASFRVIKNVVELRPIYHHKDDRVKGHVFICILAYLVTRILERKTGQTVKMLRERYATSVAIPGEKQPVILGGNDLLQAVL